MGRDPHVGGDGGSAASSAEAGARLAAVDLALFEQATLGVAVATLDGRLVHCNEFFAALIERPRSEILGRAWAEFTHPDDVAPCERERELALAGANATARRDSRLLTRYLRPDQSVVWARVAIAPFVDAGRMVGSIAFVHDVTALVLAGNAAKAAEDRLATALELASDGVWEWNMDTGAIFVSRRWLQVTGWPVGASPPDGVAWQAMLHADDAGTVGKVFGEIMAGTRDAFEHEYRMLTPRGTLRVFDRGRVLERNAANRPVRIMGSLTDLTSLRDAEDALHHARKLDSLGRLAGGIAHDFNNTLTILAGSSAVLRRHAPPTPVIGVALDGVDDAVRSATLLTKRLLAFCRKQVLEPRSIRLGALVADLAPVLQASLGEAIALSVERRTADDCVRLDPGQAEQILFNLVLNARDALPNGGRVSLVVETSDGKPQPGLWPSARVGPYVTLRVTDSGTGLSAAARAHLYEPFFTTKPHGKGTGLGLATVYGVVEQHGGFIEVDSPPGAGCTFALSFPATPPEPAPAAPLPVEWVRGTERILLVEDARLVRKLIATSLEELGYSVTAWESGESCLADAARPRDADLLVTDIVMPGIAGIELAARLRAESPDLKVLFISGYVDDPAALGAAPARGTGFLAKPFEPPQLARKLRELLRGEVGESMPRPMERATPR